jgi:hypothetical protein
MSQACCCWCGAGLRQAEVQGGLVAWVCPEPACLQRQMDRALVVRDRVLYVPLPSQCLFEECTARNVLWGGQAGPGKSHGARWWLYKRSLTVPGHTALLLRENWEQLEKTHLRAMGRELELFGARLSERTAKFPNGSVIDCGHMAEADSVSRYLSTEYGAIIPDEASLYPVDADGNTPLGELSTRARKVFVDVDGNRVPPRFMPVSNPGGPSAAWLRDMFINHEPDFEKYPALRTRYRPDDWAYIPARLDDNPYQDPDYEGTLSVLSKVRFEQLRRGDWTVFSGQFFSEWVPSVHVAEATIQ